MGRHTRMNGGCLAEVLVSTTLAVAVAGCGESCRWSDAVSESDSGEFDAVDDVPGGDASNDVVGDKGDGCKPRPLPRDLFEGWEEMQIMGCKFSVYVPSSKEYLPPPLVWEACTSGHEQINYKCRQIHMDWPSSYPAPYGLSGEPTGYLDSNGKVVFQLRKLYQRGSDRVGFMFEVVEADGPVRQAIWSGYVPGARDYMTFVSGTVAPGKSSFAFAALSGSEDYRWEWIGGDDTLLRPPTIFDRAESDHMTGKVYCGSDFYAIKGHQFGVYRWDGTSMAQIGSPSAFGSVQWKGRTLLFDLASRPWYRLYSWTEHDGVRELVGFGDDYSRGAASPGSDGKDLMWLQGEDGSDGDIMFRNRWVMTSKFSSDPSEIVPRRLTRSMHSVILVGDVPPPVGCGYAAYRYVNSIPGARDSGLQIVRLSDGAWWKLESSSTTPSEWWGYPLAITCDEVFSEYSEHGVHHTIRRVRLDSLGPPNPPVD